MTINYKPMRLGEIILYLEGSPEDAKVMGMGSDVGEYEGYREHVYITPTPIEVTARSLAKSLRSKLWLVSGSSGNHISPACYVFLAHRYKLGPSIVGFSYLRQGCPDVEPVTCRVVNY